MVCVLLGHLLTTPVVVGQSILCIACVLLGHLLTTLVVVGQLSIFCMVCVLLSHLLTAIYFLHGVCTFRPSSNYSSSSWPIYSVHGVRE